MGYPERLRLHHRIHPDTLSRPILTRYLVLARFPWHADRADELIRWADGAFLAAKRAGKNRIFLIGQDEPA